MIDRSLNYGRHLVRSYLEACSPYQYVVDLGAGHGSDLRIAQAVQPHAKCAGIEVYPSYAVELQQHGFDVLDVDIEKDSLPIGDGAVDVVIANQILEHTKNVFWILHEVTRVLKAGGSFIVGVPNLAALHNRILLCLGMQPSPIKTASAHVRGFTKGDMLRFMQVCFPDGFTLQDFGGSNFYPFPPSVARILARMFPTLAWGIFFRFVKARPYSDEFIQFPVNARLETNFYLGPGADKPSKARAHAGARVEPVPDRTN
jgi:ubiquinone/menaquinone biosynthesis C-methylase UbiE